MTCAIAFSEFSGSTVTNRVSGTTEAAEQPHLLGRRSFVVQIKIERLEEETPAWIASDNEAAAWIAPNNRGLKNTKWENNRE
ncbi:hypothetical protein PUN28_003209 [Cardiocondyla obscurior]|uniref:Uncharacterized protein n=1 Tax=Cardiocondyla obscurior TaxID=286306 RepID=A0AAW2GMN6_9HYME